MKKLPIAAVALLFGTSAYAMIPSTEPVGGWAQKDPYTAQPTTAVDPVYDEAPALQPAAVDTWTTAEPVADTAATTEPGTVKAADEVKAVETARADAELTAHEDAAVDDAQLAVADDTVAPDVQLASETTGFTTESETAPVETAVETASADLAPRPAAQNYPACRPGPGDDRCIQLYEPGVQQQLASWTQPTGGFAGSGDTQVAMGGPYEPVDDSAIETAQAGTAAMSGDGTIDTALGETADDEDMIEA